ncbi:MAG: ATP-binding protein, partial [Chloroflexota bacterium]|nr:ATP-binding protein [Chloroflexota bacterium]
SHSTCLQPRMRLNLETVSLAEVVSDVVQAVQSELESRSLQLTVDISGDIPPAWADRARLAQVLTNLMSNAYKYTPSGGAIQVRAKKWSGKAGDGEEQSMVLCAVSDTGIGIAPEDHNRVFTSFFRSKHRLTQEAEGTGLGLSITRRIVELHGGRIWVESAVGEGSTFYFTVPVARGE